MSTAVADFTPSNVEKKAPQRPVRFDPFGLLSGLRAYWIYTDLNQKGDNELSALGLTRSDLPSVAMKAAQESTIR